MRVLIGAAAGTIVVAWLVVADLFHAIAGLPFAQFLERWRPHRWLLRDERDGDADAHA